MFWKFHRVGGHLTNKCFTLQNVIQDLIDNQAIVINTQEVAYALAPAYPSIASLFSSEPAGPEVPRTSGVYLITPVLADSSSFSVDPSDHIDIAFSPVLS